MDSFIYLSRKVRIARGREERRRIMRAGAAWAKKAWEMLLQTALASVLKPMGLKIRVVGSSFIVVKKTTRHQPTSPNAILGGHRLLRCKQVRIWRPQVAADSLFRLWFTRHSGNKAIH
jgi:hypothetical protein